MNVTVPELITDMAQTGAAMVLGFGLVYGRDWIAAVRRWRERRAWKPWKGLRRDARAAMAQPVVDLLCCGHCLSTSFWHRGPSGGISQNMLCGCCGERVNYTPVIPFCEPIGVNPALRELYDAEERTPRDRYMDTAESREAAWEVVKAKIARAQAGETVAPKPKPKRGRDLQL